MTSTAYSRSSKLPGGGPERRLPPRLMRSLTSKIEPKKLGVGLVAGCCLALLTYVSLAKLFAIYSPVFASTANTSALMQNAPPTSSKPSVPETETIPPQETFGGGGGGSADPVDPREAVTGSEEPGLPEAAVTRKDMAGSDEPGLPTRKDDGDNAAVAEPTKPAAAAAAEDKKEGDDGNGGQGGGKMTCDENGVDEGFPYARPTVCELSGDVRISPKQKTVYLVNPSGAGGFDESGEKRLRPYARKDDFLMPGVTEVTVKSVPSAAVAPKCTKHHTVPAVLFSIAGYTDNFFHDMVDAMVPLFLTTSHLKGEVQLLITNYKPWWVQKYTPLLRKMSLHDVINFDAEDADDVHCFPAGAFVGLYRDRDLILSPHPTRNPRNLTMVDFSRFMRGALALPRDRPAVLGEAPGMRPRMLIISRAGTRRLLNLDEVAKVADELGFNVTIAEAGADVPAFAAQVNAADVLVGVHGAGLANVVFLPTEAVVVQIVPWGKMDWMATNFYARPAAGMALRYLEYYVGEEETSLKDKYPRDHVVFRDPMSLHTQGWQALAQTIMKQDVAVNLTKFRPVLLQALDKLQQ